MNIEFYKDNSRLTYIDRTWSNNLEILEFNPVNEDDDSTIGQNWAKDIEDTWRDLLDNKATTQGQAIGNGVRQIVGGDLSLFEWPQMSKLLR